MKKVKSAQLSQDEYHRELGRKFLEESRKNLDLSKVGKKVVMPGYRTPPPGKEDGKPVSEQNAEQPDYDSMPLEALPDDVDHSLSGSRRWQQTRYEIMQELKGFKKPPADAGRDEKDEQNP